MCSENKKMYNIVATGGNSMNHKRVTIKADQDWILQEYKKSNGIKTDAKAIEHILDQLGNSLIKSKVRDAGSIRVKITVNENDEFVSVIDTEIVGKE